MAAFQLRVRVSGPHIVPAGSLAWHTGTPKWHRAIVNVISDTCATSQNVGCEKVLLQLVKNICSDITD